jgi:hypothetical protein
LNPVITSYEDAIAHGTSSTWSLQDALEANVINTSTDQIIGGILAATYARDGSLNALMPDAIRAAPADAGFGVDGNQIDILQGDVDPNNMNDSLVDASGNNLFHAGVMMR